MNFYLGLHEANEGKWQNILHSANEAIFLKIFHEGLQTANEAIFLKILPKFYTSPTKDKMKMNIP